jgi:hypothetical protein
MKRNSADSGNAGRGIASRSGDNLASIFQPDTLLSAQYFDIHRGKKLPDPEHRLMLAILDDAIACFRDNLFAQNRKNKRLFDDAEEWIVTPGGDSIFSFDNVCETLGLNPAYLRRGLLQWRETHRFDRPKSRAWDEKKLAS